MTVETDASNYAIVGILSITTPDLEICLITFHSWSLHDAEKNYNTHNKELVRDHLWSDPKSAQEPSQIQDWGARKAPQWYLCTHRVGI